MTYPTAVREAARVVAIEAARAYVANIRPIDLTNPGVLVGHLMSAETLLMDIVAAHDEPTEGAAA
ncbi:MULTISPECIES: hypothetical protein [Streptomyces]|uniref:hypothetical protein n=1 Tax=Streptomyces TaxID=1883 RepID=UPI001BDBBE73|nr:MULTISPECIES: hypothetical protein [Streptomyces]MBT1099700.1 hypothetical protein [Streptomyces sp. Tu10]WUC88323.1 hypothetical protein OHQ35_20385 [Streptomyces anulatus]WUD90486.1 hypothetical protein OG703_20910 [Streptomyces anulatus]